jgi:hypothetical protein
MPARRRLMVVQGPLVELIGPASCSIVRGQTQDHVDSGSNSCVADHKARWRRHLSKPGDPMLWAPDPPRPASPRPASLRPAATLRPVEPAPDECKRRGDCLTSSNLGIGCRKTTDSAQSSSNFGIWCRRIASKAENRSNTFLWCRSDRNGTPSIDLAARTGPDAHARREVTGPRVHARGRRRRHDPRPDRRACAPVETGNQPGESTRPPAFGGLMGVGLAPAALD